MREFFSNGSFRFFMGIDPLFSEELVSARVKALDVPVASEAHIFTAD